jgi:hypothetical protein
MKSVLNSTVRITETSHMWDETVTCETKQSYTRAKEKSNIKLKYPHVRLNLLGYTSPRKAFA